MLRKLYLKYQILIDNKNKRKKINISKKKLLYGKPRISHIGTVAKGSGIWDHESKIVGKGDFNAKFFDVVVRSGIFVQLYFLSSLLEDSVLHPAKLLHLLIQGYIFLETVSFFEVKSLIKIEKIQSRHITTSVSDPDPLGSVS